AVGAAGESVVAAVGGDVAGFARAVDGQLADHGLAALRLGDVDADVPAGADLGPTRPAPRVGAAVRERSDPLVGDGVDVDDQVDRSERVEADVAVVVGLHDQAVRGDRG